MIGCRDWQRHTPVIVQVTREFAAFCYLSLQFIFKLKSRTIIYFDAMTVPLSVKGTDSAPGYIDADTPNENSLMILQHSLMILTHS